MGDDGYTDLVRFHGFVDAKSCFSVPESQKTSSGEGRRDCSPAIDRSVGDYVWIKPATGQRVDRWSAKGIRHGMYHGDASALFLEVVVNSARPGGPPRTFAYVQRDHAGDLANADDVLELPLRIQINPVGAIVISDDEYEVPTGSAEDAAWESGDSNDWEDTYKGGRSSVNGISLSRTVDIAVSEQVRTPRDDRVHFAEEAREVVTRFPNKVMIPPEVGFIEETPELICQLR